jgi:hypothetical protein
VAIGRELQATLTGEAAVGEGDDYRPRRGWPKKGQLEYVQSIVTVVLLLLALGLFMYYLVQSPRRALSMALARTGMKP